MTATSGERTERLRGVAKSGGISLAGAATNSLLGFALVVLVSRALGSAGAGAYSVAVAVAMTLTVAGRLGADTALVRTLPRLRELRREADLGSAVRVALVPVCAGATVFAVALWVLAPAVARLVLEDVPNHEATALLRIAAVAVPFGAGGYVALAAIRGLDSIVPLTVVENIVKPGARCALVGLVLGGATVSGVLVAWAIPAIGGAALSAWALRRALRRARCTPRADRHVAPDPRGTRREVWTFAGPRAAATVCEIAGMHAGVVLTSALASTEDAGVFNAVLRLALAGTLAMQALRLAVAPRVSRMLAADDVEGVQHVHQASTTWVVLASFPLYLLFAAWPGEVLSLFGAEFTAGGPALTLLALALLVNLATGNVSTVLLMSGRSGLTLAITAASLSIGVALTVLLAPAYGVLGAAIAKSVAVVFENIAVAVAVRRTLGVRTLSRPLFLAGGLAVCCFALPAIAVHAVSRPGLGALAATTLVSALAYAAVAWRLRRPFELSALAAVLPGPLARLRSGG